MSERTGNYYLYSYKSSNGQSVSIRLPCANLFDRTTGRWTVEEVQPQEEPPNPGMQGYQYGYFPGDESGGYGYPPAYQLDRKLGGVFLSLSISLFYIIFILLCFSFQFLKSQKHKKILFVSLAYLLLVIYIMHLKIKNNKNIFVFLNQMQKQECRIAEIFSLFYFSSFFCNSK